MENQSEAAPSTLIIYGDLPPFQDRATGKIVFDGKLNHQNVRSFEPLLRRELGKLIQRDLAGAATARLHSISQLDQLLKRRTYSTVVFYGHTITLLSSGPAENQQELALASPETFMTRVSWPPC